jgi:hypothetical protein
MINYERDGRKFTQENEYNLHYSQKGGHAKRSDHWDMLRSPRKIRSVPKEMAWYIRRSMLRDPRSGR